MNNYLILSTLLFLSNINNDSLTNSIIARVVKRDPITNSIIGIRYLDSNQIDVCSKPYLSIEINDLDSIFHIILTPISSGYFDGCPVYVFNEEYLIKKNNRLSIEYHNLIKFKENKSVNFRDNVNRINRKIKNTIGDIFLIGTSICEVTDSIGFNCEIFDYQELDSTLDIPIKGYILIYDGYKLLFRSTTFNCYLTNIFLKEEKIPPNFNIGKGISVPSLEKITQDICSK